MAGCPCDPLVDNGRGDRSRTPDAGLNYYLCGNPAKFMGGVICSKPDARTGGVRSLTYLVAFQPYL